MDELLMDYYPNRTLCDVLKEMRTMNETRNYAALLSLIEEAQTMGNRMEAKLYDMRDHRRLQEDISRAKKQLSKLNADITTLKGDEADGD